MVKLLIIWNTLIKTNLKIILGLRVYYINQFEQLFSIQIIWQLPDLLLNYLYNYYSLLYFIRLCTFYVSYIYVAYS